MHVVVLLWFGIAIAVFAMGNAEKISIPMGPDGRVTSLAIFNKTVYVPFINLSVASGQNGIVNRLDIDNITNYEMLINENIKMISPFVVRLDECHRLWILDSGVQNISGLQNKEISPALYVYDIKKNVTEEIYRVPKEFLNTESFYSNIEIDVGKSCLKSFVYASDFNARKLLVYNVETNKGKIFKHHFFNPDPLSNIPLQVMYNVEKRTINGLCGLAVVGENLVFHALASKKDFIIPRHVLHTKEELSYEDSKMVLVRPSEAGVMQFDKNNSVLFFALFKKIGCLRVKKGEDFDTKLYSEIDIGVHDGFVTDIQVVGPRLYFLVNYEKSFVVDSEIILHLIKNTPCDEKYKSLATNNYMNSSIFMLFLWTILIIN